MRRYILNAAIYRLIFIGLLVLSGKPLWAEAYWKTLFAYTDVNQIAMSDEKVFALSDGALFSVNKQSEQIDTYSAKDGLHGLNGVRIYYDDSTEILIIAYENGKIDLLHHNKIEYISGLYDKDMLATKIVNNITVHNGRAYLSMSFGIVSFSFTKQEIVDVYYIGDNASEVFVEDVLFMGDSIYAFTPNQIYKACIRDNIVDYRFWATENLGGVERDTTKGKECRENNGTIWRASNSEGIVRIVPKTGERNTYKPQGPLNNMPYSMTVSDGKLYVVSGGRWAVQYNTPGNLMVYDGYQWTNITQATLQAQTGNPVSDFMNVSVDPTDANHLFVTSYGTGVYEFQNDSLVQQYLPENSSLCSVVEDAPLQYTRCTGGVFDQEGNWWTLNTGETVLHRRTSDGEWTGIKLLQADGEAFPIFTTGDLILDNRNEHYKWIPYARYNVGLVLLDDKGTLTNADDRLIHRSSWKDQDSLFVHPESIYCGKQDGDGNVWLGTSEGVIIIPEEVDYFSSDVCVRLNLMDDNDNQPFLTSEIRTIEFDEDNQPWIGTTTQGVYVLSSDGETILAHYTTDNTLMPSNYVLSLAWDNMRKVMYIGTGNGIVSYTQYGSDVEVVEKNDETNGVDYGSMQQWTLHYSYSDMSELAQTPRDVYALAGGTLFSVNKQDETFTYWNKLTGLNGNTISHIAYDETTSQLIICYTDGRIDLLSDNGSITAMSDLYQKASNMSVTVNSIFVAKDRTYLAMPFGIVAVNTRKAEVIDTYYIGDNATDVNVLGLTVLGDSIYAICSDGIYVAAQYDNLIDYSFWTKYDLPKAKKSPKDIVTANNQLYLLQSGVLYRKKVVNGEWYEITDSVAWVSADHNRLMICRSETNIMLLNEDESLTQLGDYAISDIGYDADNACYWLSAPGNGIVKRQADYSLQFFVPNGPISNYGYRLKYIADQLFVAGGMRWAYEYGREGSFSIYDGTHWKGISARDTYGKIGVYPTDIVSFGADPNDKDKGHFFAAMYGQGLLEFRNYKAVKRYLSNNSTLMPAAYDNPNYYTRTEGARVDSEGNLWVLNTSENAHPINIMTPNGDWKGLDIRTNQGAKITLTTPWEMVVDNRDSDYVWLIDQRASTGVILFYDGGTPLDSRDDKGKKWSTFVDQDGNQITPANIYCLAQDADGDVWLGTPSGVIIIPATVDFFSSNSCTRVKIPRNDGTNLADYLLGTEQVNAIVVDGANRKWIGTETSGLYLMSADGLTTIAHFTAENSAIPSNTILSIAIHPNTGEVFVGTGSGIASYRSDASAPKKDLSGAYAFPNPVRPNYQGVISIINLMEDTEVNIVDAGGNLVCRTRSNGGIAIWDGRNFRGQRVGSGVYTALCNAADGKNHTVVKILVMN